MNLLTQVSQRLEKYIKESEQGNHPVTKMKNVSLMKSIFPLEKIQSDEGFLKLLDTYLEHTTQIHNPNYIGHQVAKPHIGAIIADLIHGATNNSAAVYDMGQAGNIVEIQLINWLCSKVGWNENSFGVLTAGGSAANLTAMLTARANAVENVWEQGNDPDLVALVPDVSHYCVARTISIMGLGSKNILFMPTDKYGKVIVEKVSLLIEQAIKDGKKPFVIVGNACSTSIGSYDDLDALGSIASDYNIWFHVDGAHGASALLSPKHRHLLKGIEKADSVVWDTHKMMATSSLCGAALFKKASMIGKTFRQEATYLNDGESNKSFSFYPYTLECTKPAYGLKAFLTYALIGEEGFAQHVEILHEKAQDFYQLIKDQDDFEANIAPESNIIVFRFLNTKKSQKEIYDQILKSGNFHITYTHFKDQEFLRLTVMNPLTTQENIEKLLCEIRQHK